MSGLDFLQGRAKTAANIKRRLVFDAEKFSHVVYTHTVSPAREVHLIAPQVNVGVGEHGADLAEEPAHEVIRAVQDGVYRSEGAGGLGARETGCEQILLAWVGKAKTP